MPESVSLIFSRTTTQALVMFVGLVEVYTMAVDWLANNVYIMDSGLKRMVICAMSTSICTSVHIPSAVHFDSIALNPHSGQVKLLLLKLAFN